jgi:hypothetical protein
VNTKSMADAAAGQAPKTLKDFVAAGSGKFLKAADVSEPKTYTIKSVSTQQLKDKLKVVAELDTGEKLVLNATNIAYIVDRLGDMPLEKLAGRKITVAAVPTNFQGRSTLGLRLVKVE